MTALDQYDRLETLGIWRSVAGDAGREVVVKFGKSSLVIEAQVDEPLAHWSLAALTETRSSPQAAIYKVDDGAPESLEIEDATMREALTRIIATQRQSPKPTSQKRGAFPILIVLALIAAAVVFGPRLLNRVALSMISPEQATLISDQMMSHLEARTGPACSTSMSRQALSRIEARFSKEKPVRVDVAELGEQALLVLPGRHIVLNRTFVERARSDNEVAGWVALGLAESHPGAALIALFESGSVINTLSFLARGQVGAASMELAVNRMLIGGHPLPEVSAEAVSAQLLQAGIPASPLVAALRRENVALQVNGAQGDLPPVLTDQQWLALQQICD